MGVMVGRVNMIGGVLSWVGGGNEAGQKHNFCNRPLININYGYID